MISEFRTNISNKLQAPAGTMYLYFKKSGPAAEEF